jgi:hypothetical protein
VERQADATTADNRLRARDGVRIVVVVLCLVVGVGAILLFTGLWKRFARETVPVLVDLPGGPWMVGGVLGLITVVGATGGLRCVSSRAGETRLTQGLRAAGTAACCTAAFGPLFYLLSGLPGKNCRSASCEYIPGTGSALLAYALGVGVIGWLFWRWTSVRSEAQAARERERLRRLRKKGKGKSRAA